MVATIVVPRNLPQPILVFGPYDEAIPIKKGLDNLLQKICHLHLLTSYNAVLPVDDVEFPILNLLPIHGLLVCGGHNTQYLLHKRVWHVIEVVQRIVHSLLLVLADCPVLWSSIHLVDQNGELLVYLKDKVVLAFWPKLLIHSLRLFVVHLLSGLKCWRNLCNCRGNAILCWSGYLHSFDLRWHFSGYLLLWYWRDDDSTPSWSRPLGPRRVGVRKGGPYASLLACQLPC